VAFQHPSRPYKVQTDTLVTLTRGNGGKGQQVLPEVFFMPAINTLLGGFDLIVQLDGLKAFVLFYQSVNNDYSLRSVISTPSRLWIN